VSKVTTFIRESVHSGEKLETQFQHMEGLKKEEKRGRAG
jgi:hypothetical protein